MANVYKWERARRGNDFIPPLLSNQDEFVPSSHIGMYALMRDEKNKKLFMSEKACQKIRLDAYKNVYDLFQEYGSPDYADFWNVNREEINELGLNAFAGHSALAPVSELIECFEKKYRLKSNGRYRYAVSFGISKAMLQKYRENYKLSQKKGVPVEVPRLRRASQKDKTFVMFGKDKFKLDGHTVEINRGAVYERFKWWCKLNGIPMQKAAEMALNDFVEKNMTDGVGEIGEYRKETVFDRYVYIQPSQTGTERKGIRLNNIILRLAEKIIERYNLDPDNFDKPYMDIDTYTNNALHLLNSKMDLKYRDPALYDERRSIEAIMRTNNIKEDELDGN